MAELKQEWINTAIEALDKVYVPYSHFPVGTYLATESGKVYQSVNIENTSFRLTNCAERTAFFKAVSEGEKTFTHLVVAGYTSDPTSLCGACQRAMAEFCPPDMPVTLVGNNGVMKAATAHALLLYTLTEKDL